MAQNHQNDDEHAHATVLGFSEQANADKTVITQFRYHDEYVCVDGEWLFASRQVLTLYAMSHAELSAGGLTHAFPSIETLATIDPNSIGIPGARRSSLTALVTALAEGRITITGEEDLGRSVVHAMNFMI